MDINKYYNPNRRIEAKVSKDWKKKYPEFCISQLPGPGIVTNEKVTPGYINYIDENYIVLDDSDSKKMDLYWAWGWIGAHLLVCSVLLFGMKLNSDFLVMVLLTAGITYPPAIWFFIKAYYMNRERKLIFDRQKGLVQVPGSFWNSSQLIRFNELHVVLALKTRFQGGVYLQLFKNKSFADKYLEGGIMLPFIFAKALQSWSYWVWYMDKNRPLPPGDALDPYRERDYERRKAEGFPAPLHTSYINTPEYFTKEFELMCEENNTIPGMYNMSINDDNSEELIAHREKKKKEEEELAKKPRIYRVRVMFIKIVKDILLID
ncbi:hypothetical protein L3049_21455 [Labilibaculum sp. DW002]|uniref:Uncharacterized protein n=1 Tax=Paralabilibaculum antarcticum TaxID=2912572 RepID=A0ABT5W0F1_9BACT|nr:hypothetical protein [Labilibaculum sp. DW002]MDE5420567.1 hypothetical protein [Labilibaculum sp. DW002]